MCKERKVGYRLRCKPLAPAKLDRVAGQLLAGVKFKDNGIPAWHCYRAARTIQTLTRLLNEANIEIPSRTD